MTTSEAPGAAQPWILQFCHGYDGPFLDCARQYAALFADTRYKVCTVYLTGKPSAEVEQGSGIHHQKHPHPLQSKEPGRW